VKPTFSRSVSCFVWDIKLMNKIIGLEKYRNLIKVFIPILIILEIADGILTYSAVGRDLVREANPLLQSTAGSESFLIMKVCGALLSALLLWLVYQRFPKLGYVASFSIMLFYASIYIWNLNIFFQFIHI
jgi:hypothetical protein